MRQRPSVDRAACEIPIVTALSLTASLSSDCCARPRWQASWRSASGYANITVNIVSGWLGWPSGRRGLLCGTAR